MTEYPEALIRKTAEAIYKSNLKPHDLEFEPDDNVTGYFPDAVAALDVLGFAPYVGPQYWRSAIHVEDYK